MQNNAIKNIVIVGGGTAGWMAAAAFSRMMSDQHITIRLVESDSIGTVGVGEATIPNISEFNAMLGIDEAEFLAATNGTFKLGIEFIDWGRKGEAYLHPFGAHGVDMEGIAFHQYWMRSHRAGTAHPIQNYSLSALAAKSNKFVHPSRDPRSVLSHMAYAYHFDATAYAGFLRRYAEKRGVKRTEGKVVSVSQNDETGYVESVTLEDGQIINGDLFFDCTGFAALLTEKTLDVGYTDWSHWLPCNSAQAVACEINGPVLPYTKATAKDAGWQWRIPTQHRTGNGYVYSSEFTDDDAATQSLLNGLDAPALGEPRQLRFTTGRRHTFWEKNVVALGLSAGFLEPLESTSIYLIQAGIARFMALFPDKTMAEIDRNEYNALMGREFDQVRDFLILHYVATERDDTPFWNYVRTMDIPDTLTRKIELFKNRGRFFRYDGDLFTDTSWVAVFLGQNIVPQHYDPLVDQVDGAQLRGSLNSMQAAMTQAVDAMPSHEDYVAKLCAKYSASKPIRA